MIKLYIIWNVAVCIMYGIDKYKAKHDKWRIKEAYLLGAAFLMGGAGAFFGMEIFGHKTKHLSFKILVPIFCIMNFVFLFIIKQKCRGF